ncbi:hypothetical protein [Citricoccus sp. SGAir0253]|uniref:hypothetical protein n=1 Tax=Citricoccus sp. SGAir0253 TaxID=2567881 RepID=UPI00143DB3EB|nr:hypothetical protein [Citricoccus sp. SGAir0253]
MSTEPVDPDVPEQDRQDASSSPEAEKDSKGPDTEQGLDEQVEETFPASDAPGNY